MESVLTGSWPCSFPHCCTQKWDTLQTFPSTASNGAVVEEPLYDLESDKTRYISASLSSSSSEDGVSQKRTGEDNLLDNPKFRFSYAAQVLEKEKDMI